MSVQETFRQRAQKFQKEAEKLSLEYNRLSAFRIIIFIAALIAFIWFANAKNFNAFLILFFTFPILFGLLVRYHNRITYRRNHARLLQKINEEEIQRLHGDLKGFPQGKEFINTSHPYAYDLDIFGEHSLFQLLNRTSTTAGGQRLGAWLLSITEPQVIAARQRAMDELSKDLEWRQGFQASGKYFEDPKSQIHTLLEWVKEPLDVNYQLLYRIAAWVMPVLFIIATTLVALQGFSIYYVIAVMGINGFLLKTIFDKVKDTTEKTYEAIKALKAYSNMIGFIENHTFQSPMLIKLQQDFKHDDFKASKAINQLQRLLDNLRSRGNMLYAIFNVTLVTDIHLLLSTIKWKKRYHEEVSHWFEAISEFEAINSLAGFHYANPSFIIPQISSEPFVFQAEELAHPLIKSEIRVANDFEMKGKGTTLIITGSNMSGKSTFLRTIGINTVLGLMGAPVCAASLTLSPLQIFTGMRTQDNLEESVSSFYAELKRIRQLLDTLKDNKIPVLYMLDEILKGTNSKDRHTGAVSLIKQLKSKNAFGLVSTHDLELGVLNKTSENTENYSFNSQIEGDEISFDYKLHHGICKSFNASKLMENMGIEIQHEN